MSHTSSLPVGVKRVRREDGARCPFSFLVDLACENDSSHFPLFSSLLRYNACVFNCSKFQISRCWLSSRNWEMCFSWLRTKEARSRRQFQINGICSYRNNTSFFDIFINFYVPPARTLGFSLQLTVAQCTLPSEIVRTVLVITIENHCWLWTTISRWKKEIVHF